MPRLKVASFKAGNPLMTKLQMIRHFSPPYGCMSADTKRVNRLKASSTSLTFVALLKASLTSLTFVALSFSDAHRERRCQQ